MKPLVTDISHHNNVTSYVDLKDAGIIGIIHKATQGTTYVDKRYEFRKNRAIDAGFLWGAYHFATGADVQKQVDIFLKTARLSDPKLEKTLLCLDFEPNPTGTSMSLRQARDWLDLVRKETGQYATIYSGHLMKELIGKRKDEVLANHKLWLCQYGPKAVIPPNWNSYWLWQYAADGEGKTPKKVAGIDGYPDLNVHYNNDPALLTLEWHKQISGEKTIL